MGIPFIAQSFESLFRNPRLRHKKYQKLYNRWKILLRNNQTINQEYLFTAHHRRYIKRIQQ